MEEITLNDYIVKIDREKTIKLYKELPKVSEKAHCGCEDCQLFAMQILNTSPDVLKFFEQFGVDPTKEAEVWRAIPNEDGFDTYTADYHFIGVIQGTDDLDWIQIGEASFGLANHDGDLPSPMIPSTFSKPIVELAVRITMPHVKM
ncbi:MULTISPECIES: hypothetical protein [Lysinibacillus]|jgi:hypothetical protein|uniref:hypothetical protein n=1 Tax=Lysinibacillus TaxID=400634 RepID=UPI0004D35C5B|nr:MULTISPECIES: hypothetical protein [Lysinibacillus]AJK87495.1 hypothetical protein HR49_10140 [Lysinibacillus fusiformis]KAB0443890.1 hypothetical protein CH314_09795 [Lysinibacillus fusiformis]KEK12602.1 hypothetical protein EP18_08295 [Lysinibacillus sphaericus]KHK53096.1 hypothetical protein PI85_07970 [Lysinibacillus sp. A1]MCE4044092.1 hypothetical protein [Lysinibacillus fusiformis]